jgi:hypothetical protein
VNREENARFFEEWLMPPPRAQFHGSESAGPVIQVNYVRFVADALKQSDGRPAKERESFKVI